MSLPIYAGAIVKLKQDWNCMAGLVKAGMMGTIEDKDGKLIVIWKKPEKVINRRLTFSFEIIFNEDWQYRMFKVVRAEQKNLFENHQNEIHNQQSLF